jgi:hypothetical protein
MRKFPAQEFSRTCFSLRRFSFSPEDVFTASHLEERVHQGTSNMKARLLPFLIGVTALAGLSACACAYAQPANPQKSALIRETCTNIMGVRTYGEMLGCTRALSDAVSARAQGDIDLWSDRYCAMQGYQQGTAQFSVCVLGAQNTHRSAQAGTGSDNAPVQLAYGSGGINKSDWTFDGRHRREQLSCAQLGLDPSGGAFDDCVTSLEYGMYSADNSSP